MPLLFFHSLLAYKIEMKTFFNTFLIKDQVIMLLINRPFNNNPLTITTLLNQAGVIIIIGLFFTACDSWTDCFHTLAMSIYDTSQDVLL